MKRLILAVAMVLATAIHAAASAISIDVFAAPDKTYANTANTPCIFYGTGLSGCNKDPVGWPEFTSNTGGGQPPAFTPYPLEQTYSGLDLVAWNAVVGDTFVIALDINQSSTDQVLDIFSIQFYGPGDVLLKEYSFGPPTAAPDSANGIGYADYVLAAGCSGVEIGDGFGSTCIQAPILNGPVYTPFVKPVGTTSIVFNFGLTGFNDGADKIFAIPTNPIGTPNQNCVDDPTIPGCDGGVPVPEPASLVLLGSGLIGMVFMARRRRK